MQRREQMAFGRGLTCFDVLRFTRLIILLLLFEMFDDDSVFFLIFSSGSCCTFFVHNGITNVDRRVFVKIVAH